MRASAYDIIERSDRRGDVAQAHALQLVPRFDRRRCIHGRAKRAFEYQSAPQHHRHDRGDAGSRSMRSTLEGTPPGVVVGQKLRQGYTARMAKAPALLGWIRASARAAPARGSARSTRSRSRSARPTLAKRSIKRESKLFALELAVRMMDLTTLEGADTPGKVAALCSKAMRPDPGRSDACRRSPRSASTRTSSRPRDERLAGSSVKVASVATAFPSGQSPLDVKLAEARDVGRARRGRDRHGHRPRRVPLGPLRQGLRRDRAGEGGAAATRT